MYVCDKFIRFSAFEVYMDLQITNTPVNKRFV